MHLHWPKPNRRFGAVDALGVAGLVGLLVARYVPVARLPFWGCGFRRLTGLPCPGCGLTRVADRLSHFHLRGAFDANPLGTVAALGFAAIAVWTVLHLSFGVPVPEAQLDAKEARLVRWTLALAVTVNYGFMLYRAMAGWS